MTTIGFLHTAAVHEPTFAALVRRIDAAHRTTAVVDAALLDDARRLGPTHPSVEDRTVAHLQRLRDLGADAIVCTCSTLGATAERLGVGLGPTVVRVDRAMAEAAVDAGGRIGVVAALESTIEPTTELLHSVAAARGVTVDVRVTMVDGAWDRFESGDVDGYLDLVARACSTLAEDCDVIVLAQASMAPVAERMPPGIPVLSSPRLAVDAAVRSVS